MAGAALPPAPRELWRRARSLDVRRVAGTLARAYAVNDILTAASAIAFQVAFALIPFTLCVLGLLGSFHLEEVWQRDVRPQIAGGEVSPAALTLIDETVRTVLGRRQLFWATLGAGLAVWEASGAIRGVMGVLDRIYDIRERRSTVPRFAVSLALALVVSVTLLAAVAVARFGAAGVEALVGTGTLARVAGLVLRWAIAVVLLLVTVGLLVRYAPSAPRPWRWVSFGAVVTVAGWIAMTLAFEWYLTSVANYGSIFGALATVVIVFEYLYLSSIVFLTGLLLDGLARDRSRPGRSGDRGRGA
jgi:membrane protein